jgi:hypothetical protein
MPRRLRRGRHPQGRVPLGALAVAGWAYFCSRNSSWGPLSQPILCSAVGPLYLRLPRRAGRRPQSQLPQRQARPSHLPGRRCAGGAPQQPGRPWQWQGSDVRVFTGPGRPLRNPPLLQAAGVVASEANGVGSSGGEGGRTVYVGDDALSFKRDHMEVGAAREWTTPWLHGLPHGCMACRMAAWPAACSIQQHAGAPLQLACAHACAASIPAARWSTRMGRTTSLTTGTSRPRSGHTPSSEFDRRFWPLPPRFHQRRALRTAPHAALLAMRQQHGPRPPPASAAGTACGLCRRRWR